MNIDSIITLRKDIHQEPEGGFLEFETQKKVRKCLESFGIDQERIKECAKTGLVVDIVGEADDAKSKKVMAVALRADMDGLPIPENNPHLSYKSQTKFAHMCGHDGHMATLLSAA